MEQNRNPRLSAPSPEAATDEHASSSNLSSGRAPPAPAEAEVENLVSDCLTETFVEGGRKPRHDGWTPERVGTFLRALAACGCIEDAAQAAGLSAQSAYGFRNRRSGRAFAKMWDAILIHRGRARLAGTNMSRAVKGCVSLRKRDGIVVEEYHHPDNRLSMALLARLDKLAEKEAPNEEHLRALSEDMDAFIECVEAGGDADAFVEARKPAPPPAPPMPPAPPPRRKLIQEPDLGLDTLARLRGLPDYRDVHPFDVPVGDLDPARMDEWESDQWIRAFRSGFMTWLEVRKEGDSDYVPGPSSPADYIGAATRVRREHYHQLSLAGRSAEIDISDLDWAEHENWTEDQWDRAGFSGMLDNIPEYLGDRQVEVDLDGDDEVDDEGDGEES